MTINWQELSRKRCYPDSKSMLIDLYYAKSMSRQDIADWVDDGTSSKSVGNEMDRLRLPRRGRGGNNNPDGAKRRDPDSKMDICLVCGKQRNITSHGVCNVCNRTLGILARAKIDGYFKRIIDELEWRQQ